MKENKYICTYPFYRSFKAGYVYDGCRKDPMTGTTVEEWAKHNPDHWVKL